jgi:hypothetical protein
MINPYKVYSASQIGVITRIDSRDAYTDQFTVSYGTSGTYSGYISDIPNFERFKVGDHVHCGMIFSITLDRFLIKRMRRVLK